MSRRGHDAIVVGAGVVGACAALALARSGLRVALIEARVPAPRDDEARDLRVYALSPGSIAQLHALGVWNTIAARRAQPYREMRVWDAAGNDELHFRAADIGSDTLGRIVEQSVIQDALWAALGAEGGVDRRCPGSIVALEQGDAGVVLELDDGSALSAPLAIAADGAESKLRQLAGLQVLGHPYAQRAIVAYVQTQQPHGDTAWQRFLPGGPLAVLPCTEGLSSIVWTVADDDCERLLALAGDAFGDELTRAFDARLGAMQLASPRAAFPLRLQLATRYVAGRVVLAGDAAHVVHPLAGQGVNLGLRDVDQLVQTLTQGRERGSDIGGSATLRRYERVRRSENAIAAGAFDAINRVYSNNSVLPTLLRGRLLGLVDRLTPLRRLFARHAAGQVR
jgi:2-octaprenyl-3-methyl-6-methoxy-1,4-benzoquinol hydroxylase